MEDQGKRLFMAVAIVAVMWAVYVSFFAPKPAPPAPVVPATTVATTAPGAAASAPTAAAGVPAAPTVTVCDPTKAGTVGILTSRVDATFSGCGGALSSWKLIGSQYGRKEQGKLIPADLVAAAADGTARFFPLQLALTGSTATIDPGATWTLSKENETTVVATLVTDELELSKRFVLHSDRYTANLTLTIKNRSSRELDQHPALALYGWQDPHAKEQGMFNFADPHYTPSCHVGGEVESDAYSSLSASPRIRPGEVRWVAVDHKYFMFAAAPMEVAPMSCASRRFDDAVGVIAAELVFPSSKLAPGASITRNVVLYIGPKHLDRLQEVSTIANQDVQLEDAVQLGWFGFIAKPLLWLLKKFYGMVGNWGVAIIMLTIVVKLLTLYWTTKSMRSMKAMSKLKPKMDELKEKYGADKQRLNTEMMNMYKTYKINPLGGCLPMLLQMPIWFALYSALGAAAELYQAPFILWIQDLTRPDQYYVIPVVVAGLMFLQQRISPAAMDSSQAKVMMYAMPLMFGAFSLFFPAGLTLYILTNTVLTFLHQLYMNSTDPDEIAKKQARPASDRPVKA